MKKLLAAILVAALAFVACQKEYSIETGQNANLTGAWEFKDSTTTLRAGNSVDYYIDDSTNPAQALMSYTGATANLTATLTIEVLFPTGTAAIGSYQSANGEVVFNYAFNNSGRFYQVNGPSGQFTTENITVTITQISDSAVTGTFSGTALDSANRLVTIREGKFNYRKRGVVTPPVTASVGTLGSAVDTCTGAVVAGTFRKNTALTGANTVTLTVNVTTAGSYTISSDTLKGISFRSTGTFAATGVQTVTLPGVGTPTDSAAALRFRVRYGTSNCTFLVKIDTGSGVIVVVPPTGDYFPTTANSTWRYDDYDENGFFDTSFTRATARTIVNGGNPFIVFREEENGTIDSNLYRKNAGIYYTLADLTGQFGSGGTVATQFLKDNVALNGTWTETFTLTGTNAIKFDYKIIGKQVTASVTTTTGTISSVDVIKVETVVSQGVGTLFAKVGTIETWYGRGIGKMYTKITSPLSNTQFIEERLKQFTIF